MLKISYKNWKFMKRSRKSRNYVKGLHKKCQFWQKVHVRNAIYVEGSHKKCQFGQSCVKANFVSLFREKGWGQRKRRKVRSSAMKVVKLFYYLPFPMINKTTTLKIMWPWGFIFWAKYIWCNNVHVSNITNPSSSIQ